MGLKGRQAGVFRYSAGLPSVGRATLPRDQHRQGGQGRTQQGRHPETDAGERHGGHGDEEAADSQHGAQGHFDVGRSTKAT